MGIFNSRSNANSTRLVETGQEGGGQRGGSNSCRPLYFMFYVIKSALYSLYKCQEMFTCGAYHMKERNIA